MARRPERNFFEQLRRNFPKCGLPYDLQRIENTTCNGVADVSYCIAGVDGWAELKAWERIRFSGRFTVPKLREEQAAWLARRATVGGRAYLLAKINKDIALIDGRLIPALFDKTLHLEWNMGKEIATIWLEHPVDWVALSTALVAPPAATSWIEERLGLFTKRPVTADE